MRPIDADALKNAFEEDGHLSGYIEEFIDDMPTLDVAPVVHGRWEKWNGDDRHHCTACECYANEERDAYGYITSEFLDNYCPNCGARMD